MKNYLSLIKFSHTIFALPFALIGFFLATQYFGYPFTWQKLVLMLLCMLFARSAAMAFNRYIDRTIDEKNPRTATRHIPAGIISAQAALGFVILNCILFVLMTYLLNPLCFYLSPVALTIVLGYSYTKRFTAFCHFILGLGLALAPIGAFLAVSEQFALLPVLYSLAVLLWVSGFDMVYALQDVDFDRTQQLYSMPVRLGRQGALHLSIFLHVLCAGFIIGAGIFAQFGYWYWIATSLFLVLLVRQHTLVSPTDLSKVNLAFFTTNGLASIIFATFFLFELFFNN